MNGLFVKKNYFLLKLAAVILTPAVAFLPIKYTHSVYGYLPGLGLLFFWFLSTLYLLVLRRRIRIETDTADVECCRGERVRAAIKIINDSFLNCSKLSVCLFLSDSFGREISGTRVDFTLEGNREKEFPLHLKMNHIGVYSAGIGQVKIYDLAGLFSVTIPVEKTFQITVLPRIGNSEEVRLEEKQLTENQNAKKSAASDGFDYSGVREYALGDSMKRIHWKLSAHSPTYMTKITESARKSDLTVVIDFVTTGQSREEIPYLYDCLVETALALAEQALMKEVECSLLFIGEDREINRILPKGAQDYPKLVTLLPASCDNPYLEFSDGAALLEKEKHLSNKSANLILCSARITEKLVQELIQVKHQQRNPALYCIVPWNLSKNQLEKHQRSLALLEDYGIPYYFIAAEGLVS